MRKSPFDDGRLSVVFLQKLFSFAECFAQKVEEMVLQHLFTLSMKGHELDGLKIEENLRQSKRHFFRFVKRPVRRSLNRMWRHILVDPDTIKSARRRRVFYPAPRPWFRHTLYFHYPGTRGFFSRWGRSREDESRSGEQTSTTRYDERFSPLASEKTSGIQGIFPPIPNSTWLDNDWAICPAVSLSRLEL